MAGRNGGKRGGGHDVWTVVVGVVAVCIALAAIAGGAYGGRALEALGLRNVGVEGMHASGKATERNPKLSLRSNPSAEASSGAGLKLRSNTGSDKGLSGLWGLVAPSASPSASASASASASSSPSGSAGSWSAGASSPVTAAAALKELGGIKVASPHTDGYSGHREDLFGKWAYQPTAMCGTATTRDLILKRDMTDVRLSSKCKVESGTLADPYTGGTIRFDRAKDSLAVQIDHVVAVQDAYASGAWRWSQSKRVAYANDPLVLVAADGGENEAKGSGVASLAGSRAPKLRAQWGGEVWLPSNKAYRCDYMAKRVHIKSVYGLSMTGLERAQSRSVLSACVAR